MAGLSKLVGESFRDQDRLTTAVSRHLLKRPEGDRRADCIHPSEASHEDWCKRATYYRIIGIPPEPTARSLAMEMVFETGHDAHRKWQTWLWEMGMLSGEWKCLACSNRWSDTSPEQCPACGGGRKVIEYAEVRADADEYLIHGRSDGEVFWNGERRLIEIKTIGPGTVRWEAPSLVAAHTYKHTDETGRERSGVDWQALWNSIRRPFPSHIRQGMIYCMATGVDSIVYIYDPKFLTAGPKEFTVKYRRDLIEDLLEECLIVKASVENGRAPKRPFWAETSCRTCKECSFKGVCWNGISQRHGDGVPAAHAGQSRSPEPGDAPTRPTRVRLTSAPAQAVGAG